MQQTHGIFSSGLACNAFGRLPLMTTLRLRPYDAKLFGKRETLYEQCLSFLVVGMLFLKGINNSGK